MLVDVAQNMALHAGDHVLNDGSNLTWDGVVMLFRARLEKLCEERDMALEELELKMSIWPAANLTIILRTTSLLQYWKVPHAGEL